jgi:Flp pilus assembly protein CpaB
MKAKSLLLLVVAGGCGLVAAIAAAQHLAGNQTTAPVAPPEDHKNVVVAIADIEPVLTGKLGRGLQYLANELPQGMKACTSEISKNRREFTRSSRIRPCVLYSWDT